jgi:formylglycine-generating enzyme required for sulfatase activity
MRISPIVLLLFAMLGCGSGSEPAKTPAESGGNQTQSPKTETQLEKSQPASNKAGTAKTPDAATVKKQMTPAQLALGKPVVNSVGMLLVPIPAGTFTMGEGKTAHKVTLTQAFHLGQYEVTQEQYEKVMGKNPSYFKGGQNSVASNFKGGQNPVEQVSWNDAVEFCRKLSALPAEKKAGYVYRLPTEAEWEYACRAGTKTTYSFGDSESELGDRHFLYGWYYKNSEDTTHPVGGKKPNGWGLYDMHGNVWEWCQDWYGKDYYGNSPASDPRGPTSGSSRVVRGGSWYYDAQVTRSAFRNRNSPDHRDNVYGFRVVCELD